jgi:hypothetical protein
VTRDHARNPREAAPLQRSNQPLPAPNPSREESDTNVTPAFGNSVVIGKPRGAEPSADGGVHWVTTGSSSLSSSTSSATDWTTRLGR